LNLEKKFSSAPSFHQKRGNFRGNPAEPRPNFAPIFASLQSSRRIAVQSDGAAGDQSWAEAAAREKMSSAVALSSFLRINRCKLGARASRSHGGIGLDEGGTDERNNGLPAKYFNLLARIGGTHTPAIDMAKSSNLSYHPPFRYQRPGEDLEAVFGAKVGNPRLVPAASAKTKKPATAKKKGQSGTGGKSRNAGKSKLSKPASSKPAVSKKAKAKKPAGKR
jgi:hypothetical protein